MNLFVNPNVILVRTLDGKKITGFLSPVKGKGLIASSYRRNPKLLKKAISAFRTYGRTLRALNATEKDQLRHRGFLILRAERSKQVLYRCDLGTFLSPGARKPAYFDRSKFLLNENIEYRTEGGTPPLFSKRLVIPEELRCDGPMIWVEDANTKIIYPYGIGGELENTFRRFCIQGKSGTYNPDHIQLFQTASILCTPKNRLSLHSINWSVQFSQKIFREKHSVLPALLNPLHLQALQKYSRSLLEQGWLQPPKNSEELRMTRHNEPIARFFHLQMGGYFSALMGASYKPSFCFNAIYRPGSILKKHTDRPQCDVACSTLLDYEPQRKLSPWPLFLEIPNGRKKFRQKIFRLKIGETLVYRGRTIPHSRPPLPDGHASSHIFWFFVPSDFKGSLR